MHVPSLTPADRVTLTRALLLVLVAAVVVLGLVVPAASPTDVGQPLGHWGWVVVALAVPMLVLDAVDGAVARRTVVTARGARFDEETDAAAVLVLSVAAAVTVGPWTVLAGLLRYAFLLAGTVLPPLRERLEYSLARRVVAAVQGPALLLGVVPGVSAPLAATACGAALVALLWSFGRDVHQLLSRARARQVQPQTEP